MSAPRWACALLRRLAPPGRAEDVVGDLEEVHNARVARLGGMRASIVTAADALAVASTFALAGVRHWRGLGWMSATELKLALRVVRRTPVMTVTSVFALAVGIGLATTGFTVVDAILHPVLPFAGGERIVEIRLLDAETLDRRPLEPGLFDVLRDGAGLLSWLGAARSSQVNLSSAGEAVELVAGVEVTPSAFAQLPFRTVVGRLLTPEDAAAGAAPVALIGARLWERRFARERSAIGGRLNVGGVERTIVGVLPDDAVYPAAGDVWLPLDESVIPEGRSADAGIALFGVLGPDVDRRAAEAQLTAVAARWSAGRGVEPLAGEVRGVGEIRRAGGPAATLIGLLVAMLVVMAGNVANLVIARTAARRSELAVRTALGASRPRLIGQLTVEVLLITAAGAALGLWASQHLLGIATSAEASELPPWWDMGLTARTAGFVAGVSALVTVVAGMLPALRMTRADPAAVLRGGGRAGGRALFGRHHDAMVMAQIALSIGIFGAAVMVNQGWMRSAGGRTLDIPAEAILAAQVGVPAAERGVTADSLRGVRVGVENAVARMPDVIAATTATHLPGTDAAVLPFVLETSDGADGEVHRLPSAEVGPGYFDVLGAKPGAGRTFSAEHYGEDPPPVAIVNQPFVRRYLGGGSAIGRRIRVARPADTGSPIWREIIGVVPDLGLSGADPERAAGVYLPIGARARFRVLARTRVPPAALAPALRAAVFGVDAELPVSGIVVLSQELALARRAYAIVGSALSSLGLTVLLLSLAAMYAILSFEVTRRTREIGIRVALGATRGGVLAGLIRRVVVYVAAGSVAGAVFGFLLLAVARATFVLTFPRTNPLTFLALAAVVMLAALIAAWTPARRALGIDPMDALRAE